jgi:hypothetical protein
MAYALGQMPRPTTLEDGDYDFVTGLGIEAQYGVGKIAKAPQNGPERHHGRPRGLGHGDRLRRRTDPSLIHLNNDSGAGPGLADFSRIRGP